MKITDLNEKLEPVEKHDQIPFSSELWRKALHLVSLAIPIIYTFLSRDYALRIIFVITIIAIIIDILIKEENFVQRIIFKFFGKIFRKYERSGFVFNGATWMLISATINMLIFPKILTVTSFYILVIADACSALFGKRFGKTKFLNKSLEGSIAFCISGSLVLIAVGIGFSAPLAFFVSGLIGVGLASIVEASSAFLRVDDNLGVPLTLSSILWLGSLIGESYGMGFIHLL
jgi:dolichol kinase